MRFGSSRDVTGGKVLASASALLTCGVALLPLVFAANALRMFFVVVLGRLSHPSQIEWMIGGVYDHVARIKAGLPLYSAPSTEFVAFVYPPLYYRASAGLATLVGSIPLACRLVALVSTLGCAACVVFLARRLGARWYFALIALGLFFAAYSYTGYWYDLERCDSLFVLLLLMATSIVVASPRLPLAGVSGALMGLAFFAKQPALPFLMCGALGLGSARGLRQALVFGIAGAACVGLGLYVLHVGSGGWSSFYLLKVPAAHGLKLQLLPSFIGVDVAGAFLLALSTIGLLVLAGSLAFAARAAGTRDRENEAIIFFAAMLVASFIASASSRLHEGGWENVLMFWSTFASVAAAVVATRTEDAASAAGYQASVSVALTTLTVLQMAHWWYSPHQHSSSAEIASSEVAFRERVRKLERSGEVLVMNRGNVTRVSHLHSMALYDILRAGSPLPPDLSAALANHRFAAVVIGDFERSDSPSALGAQLPFTRPLISNYYVAQRWDAASLPAGNPDGPEWVLLPRAHSLSLPDEALLRRRALEERLAALPWRELTADARGAGATLEALSVRLDTTAKPELESP